jgi:hypothetical protein
MHGRLHATFSCTFRIAGVADRRMVSEECQVLKQSLLPEPNFWCADVLCKSPTSHAGQAMSFIFFSLYQVNN